MGRTVLPFSQVMEREYGEWKKFRRALRKEDQEAFDRLFDRAKLHVQAGAYASSPWPLESILLSICLEHEKLLSDLVEKLERLTGNAGKDTSEIRMSKPETNPKS